jgi:membrane protein YdbS with pleckstrin-like domain
MNIHRIQKERGAKIYEVFLHIVAILSLLLAFDCSNNEWFIPYSKVWWAWLILTYIAVKRLFILDLLKREARKRGIMLTELTEELQEEIKNKNDIH